MRSNEITKVKKWFIEQMKELVEEEEALLAHKGSLPSDEMLSPLPRRTASLTNT